MGKREKRIEAMRGDPHGWRFDEVRSILESEGFLLRPGAGSHRVFKHPGGARVTSPDRGSGTVLPVYVEAALEAIDRAREAQK
jgi:predicted RNA binding protein YcfA (HicA-like mRNA interferase family)